MLVVVYINPISFCSSKPQQEPHTVIVRAPVLAALGKQGILNLRTLLGGTRIVAVLVNPVFDYESKLLSAVKRK